MDKIFSIILLICISWAGVLCQSANSYLDTSSVISASYNTYKSIIDPYCVTVTTGQQQIQFATGQSMENLIALIERLELNLENSTDQNLRQHIGADNVAKLFLRRFRFDGYDRDGSSVPYQFQRDSNFARLANAFFTQTDSNIGGEHTYYFPENLYSQAELCSLYYMLSHNMYNMNDNRRVQYSAPFLARGKRQAYPQFNNRQQQQYPQNYGNTNQNQNQNQNQRQVQYRPIQHADTAVQSDYLTTYPIREEGVVSFRSNRDEAIAAARVLIGVIAGLTTDMKTSANQVLKSLNPLLTITQDKTLDPVMAVTIADLWGFASGRNTDEKKYYYGLKGKWSSGSCTTHYALTDVETSQFPNATKNMRATKAEIRGGLDGYLIGKNLQTMGQMSGAKKPRLSQILRSYYSKPKTQKTSTFTVSYCNRDQTLNMQQLQDTATGYAAILTKYQTGGDPEQLLGEFTGALNQAQQKETNGYQDYCNTPGGVLDKTAPCESPSDVIYVIDGQNSQKLQDSAKIVSLINGNLNNFRTEGGTVSIFFNSFGQNNINPDVNRWLPTGPGGWPLVPAAFNSTNTGSAQCRIADFNTTFPPPVANTAKYLEYLNRTLMNYEYWNPRTNASAVPSKTAVIIDFGTVPAVKEGKDRNDFNYYKDELRYRQRDVRFLTLTNTKELFQEILRDDTDYENPTNIEMSASRLAQKICENPSTFQYNNCYQRRSDNIQYTGYVTPGYKQNWAMYPEFFLKSFNIRFSIKPEDGEIKVCYDRWFPPERNDPNYCKEVKSGEEAVFTIDNPCKGKSVYSCDPFYFTIWGKDRNTNTQCLDDGCLSMDQIKFTVSHSGVQCNSSKHLLPSISFQLISLSIFAILYLFLNK